MTQSTGDSADNRIRVHLVLSAGGVKCLSYAGAIPALVQAGLSFASVSGASAGSLIGAVLCSKAGLKAFQDAVYSLDLSTLGAGTSWIPWLSLVRRPFAAFQKSRVAETFRALVGGDPLFRDLDPPFATFGVDLRSHKIHVYSSKATPGMPVAEALRISTAAPFLFPIQEEGESLLVDGAVVSQSPVWLASVFDDDLPILVLRPKKQVVGLAPRNALDYVASLIDLGGGSRDYYVINQMPRARLVEIDCGAVQYDQMTISNEMKQSLVASGQDSVEKRLKDLLELLKGPQSFRKTHIEDARNEAVRAGDEAMTALLTSLPRKRDQLFISYSHDDSAWLYKFQDALKPYTWNKAINLWDDTQIPVGAIWQEEIKKALDVAKVAVLLVSIKYLASDFIRNVELQEFLQASRSDGLRVFPVAIGASSYEQTVLRDYQFANNPEEPLNALNVAAQEAELVRICKEIKKSLDS